MNVALAVEEAAGVQALRLTLAAGHHVPLVLTSAPRDPRRGATVADLAGELGIAVRPAALVRAPECAEVLRDADVDLLLNVHSLHVVHAEVLRAPRIGAFNLHPGPLPHYAGLNAPSWALLRGEPTHAVSVHWMTPGIDAGAVAYQATFDLADDDTGLSVSARCVRLGLPLLQRLLDDAARGGAAGIPAHEQDRSRRRYYGREVPFEGRIHWALPATSLARFVRACDYRPLPSPWGEPQARLDGEPVAVLAVALTGRPCTDLPGTVDRAPDDVAIVATGDEWLRVDQLRVRGRRIDARDVLVPGAVLADGG